MKATAPLSLSLLLLLSGLASAAPVEAVFQYGSNGYHTSADTYVSKSTWGTPSQITCNYGQAPTLYLSRNGGDNLLLRFDLSAIPAHSVILSAKLELYHVGDTALPRVVDLFRVTKPWLEGNRPGQPISAPGHQGATGNHAADYFENEGEKVPWGAVAMAPNADFNPTVEAQAAAGPTGWVEWDVQRLVAQWVRGEHPNHGLTLRDHTGYQNNNPDWRTFHSNQAANSAFRPRLTIVYNPHAPMARAGDDREQTGWAPGSPVEIDGSTSADFPGGDAPSALQYQWRVKKAAFGSDFTVGQTVGTEPLLSFTPDVAGDWEFELVVTNSLGESAHDEVALRVWNLISTRPRIYLTPEKVAELQARAASGDPRWAQLLNHARNSNGYHNGEAKSKALAWLITGEPQFAEQAIERALALIAETTNRSSTRPVEVALIYDWCHAAITPEQRATFLAFFEAWMQAPPEYNDLSGWGNYWPRWSQSWVLVGLATHGESPLALSALRRYRDERWMKIDVPLHDQIADGGNWPEGTVYDWVANYPKVMSIEAWRVATGENLFLSTDWFRQRFGTWLMQVWPGQGNYYGRPYRLYPSIGDAERNRHSINNYGRATALVLGKAFPNEPLARQLQSTMAALPPNNATGLLMAEEFIYFDAAHPSTPPTLRSHFARGTGTVFMRSGWPTGGSDHDRNVTHAIFQCGDFFSYHQHYDQNSFTLFKGGDLLIDSGVYSGEGTSYHDRNYYVRTIAHNTLVVYNPAEDLRASRSMANLNDGGQRSPTPGNRSPATIEHYRDFYRSYERGKIREYRDTPEYTYLVGDATLAYNSTLYNQAQDTTLSGNVAKITRYVREFLYLRDPAQPGASVDEKVIVVDRVGLAQAAFSGSNTKLLFHTLHEPSVSGAMQAISPGETLHPHAAHAMAQADNGELVFQFLHPAQRNVRKVGGAGQKSAWVFGTNADYHWFEEEPLPRPTNGEFDPVPYGEWRLELEPADNGLDHVFITVLHPRLKTDPEVQLAHRIEGEGVIGVRIPRAGVDEVVCFSSQPDGSAPQGEITLHHQAERPVRLRVFNLEKGARYELSQSGSSLTLTPSPTGAAVVGEDGSLLETFAPPEMLEIIAPRLEQGEMVFHVVGTAGSSVVIERSTDLHTWEPAAEGTLGSEGYEYREPLEGDRAFYRARIQTP